ncbi:sporulation integral membrane protein YlbJ [Clostridia bacterium]|nr:sporulation integral membrane protein YlbJ [Clostridia bacterium]
MKRFSLYVVDILLGVSVFVSVAAMIISPREAAEAARQGIKLCMDVIVPSLFPFFVLSSLTVELGLTRYLGRALERVMRPVFRVGGACSAAVVMGFIGGYPVGARTALALYESGQCTKTEAERLLSFCNNSGPAFILGAVGAGIFSSSTVGWLLYLAHTAASLTVGVLFRFYKYRDDGAHGLKKQNRPAVRVTRAFVTSVRSSFDAILGVCAFVIFFAVAIRMLYAFGTLTAISDWTGELLRPLGVERGLIDKLFAGLIEVTSGLWTLQSVSAEVTQKLAMAAFMLGWAGVSVHCQVLTFIGESNLRTWPYIVGKLLHGVISAAYMVGLLQFFHVKIPVSSFLLTQMDDIMRMDSLGTLSATLWVSAILLCAAILLAGFGLLRKNYKTDL